MSQRKVLPPPAHPSGVKPPRLKADQIPAHVALVMDGNGRWAKERGLPRTAGHEAGEASLLDVLHGAIEIGVKEISAYAFSTENWRRSPEEVKFGGSVKTSDSGNQSSPNFTRQKSSPRKIKCSH